MRPNLPLFEGIIAALCVSISMTKEFIDTYHEQPTTTQKEDCRRETV